MEDFQKVLEHVKIKILKYDPAKLRPIGTNTGTMDVRKFSKIISERLGGEIAEFPALIKAVHDVSSMEDIIAGYAEKAGVVVKAKETSDEIIIPPELANYTLNVNTMYSKKGEEFFLTTRDEFKSLGFSGEYYIQRCNIPLAEAYSMARGVKPVYNPRGNKGVTPSRNPQTGEKIKVFNTYIPPDWETWKVKNPTAWKDLPESCPRLLLDLLQHLIPSPKERRYFYGWLYASLTKRAYVYLILCGAPGTGKNRLKLVMKALHGKQNTVDGKKSTLTEKFNSQLSEGTLIWFDELKYTEEMENVMKEIQNDNMSIEKKGVDATESTDIHASMVISNNKPRDNFIAFDARKFTPLVIGKRDLKTAMSQEKIEDLSRKVDQGKEGYDILFVAQIAKWILRTGRKHYLANTSLEYKGKMFWTLAHTSMTRWQKRAIAILTENPILAESCFDQDEGGYLWSALEDKYKKRSGDRTITFPDYSSVRAFFEAFRNGSGVKAFNTKVLPGSNILGDFWIFTLTKNLDVITEASVTEAREKGATDGDDKEYAL